MDICYLIVQSGGEYELKMSAVSTDKKLHYGVVHISLARATPSTVPTSDAPS